MRCGIALGSNLGDRLRNLETAFQKLRDLSAGEVLTSRIYETDPVDCEAGAPSFLNAVAEIEFQRDPADLMRHLRDIEQQMGRTHQPVRNAPRIIDLDLLYCDAIIWNDDQLTLPHPRILERRFVLAPLCDIRPELILPLQSKTVSEILKELPEKPAVTLLST
jgi:2-amino-4-hydroxy-6-hydroxymethyldihydropteridine diphosphokinase